MQNHDAKNIFKKYRGGNASAKEKAQLEQWVDQISSPAEFDLGEVELLSDLREIRRRVRNSTTQKKIIPLWARISAAASVLVITSIAVLLYKNHQYVKQQQLAFEKITPGGTKATLTLANGKQIFLSANSKGIMATQGNMVVSMNARGQVIYSVKNAAVNKGAIAYNTLTVPNGGQCQVFLPDSTHVWVNAGSILRYPSSFAANERRVELTGEAYFEVKHNSHAPFRIASGNQVVEDLGTEFDIEAYPGDKTIATTLVEGSASVTGNGKLYMLIPGQQAVNASQVITIKNEQDIESIIAWKNGLFKFNGSLEDIMRQISRWYDVSVVYDPRANRDKIFSGEISRSRNILSILKIMESTGKVNFKIEGRRITVMP